VKTSKDDLPFLAIHYFWYSRDPPILALANECIGYDLDHTLFRGIDYDMTVRWILVYQLFYICPNANGFPRSLFSALDTAC
jgi:hypothetical protein